MKLSTRGRYGVRALLELCLRGKEAQVHLKDIARNQQIPLAYLEQLIRPLSAAGIIRSMKGPRGGIYLNKEPSEISLLDIIRIYEGSLAPSECVDNPDICERALSCVVRDIWTELKDSVTHVLESTTLQDLSERQEEKRLSLTEMYNR